MGRPCPDPASSAYCPTNKRRRSSGRVAGSSGYSVIPHLIIKGQATMNFNPGNKVLFGASLGLAALLCAGCGPATTTMSGTVTYKNKPLTSGIVTFVTDQGSANGTIDKEGSYTVETVPVGTAKVSVFSSGGTSTTTKNFGPPGGKDRMTTPKGIPPEAEKAFAGAKQGATGVNIPSKYSDPNTSDLKVEVKSGQNPPFNIELKD